MKNLLRYKGFLGTVDFSDEDNVLFGKVIGIRDHISYEGATIKDLKKDFKEAIDYQIAYCKKTNLPIHKSLTGNFNVRINPELHQQAARASTEKGISLNKYVQEAIQSYVQEEEAPYKPRRKKKIG